VTVFGIVTNARLLQAIQILTAKVDAMSSQQDEVNAIVTEEETALAGEAAARTQLSHAITDLEKQIAAGAPLDLSGLHAAAAALDTETAAEQAAVPNPLP
jgi:hypothetical protein